MLGEKELLHEAIGRNCGVVLSLPSAGLLRHHKSRFLAQMPAGFWIESVPSEHALLDELVRNGTPAGLSFRTGVHKVMLATPILRREPSYRLNAETTVEALLLAEPQQVKAVQRRANYRVPVASCDEFRARVWRVAPGVHISDRPSATQELPCEAIDLSLGGIGVRLRACDKDGLKVSIEDRLRIELTYGETQLILEGTLRYPGVKLGEPGPVRAGLQFKPLDIALANRQKLTQLTRIIGELHRHEVRRARRDMVTNANSAYPAGAPELAASTN